MRRESRFLLLALVVLILSTGPAYGQACEGTALAATTETRHFDCYSPEEALKWTLNIACMDACGKVWWTLAPQPGVVDGSCHRDSNTFCTPTYQRKDYTKGLYAETSAFPTRHTVTDGKVQCVNRSQVITLGDCPCAPACGSNDGQCDISSDGGTWQDGGTTSPDDPQGCCYSKCSPILINLGGDGFHLTGAESPVRFDIDADGDVDAISWTAADADEAFLALDRNGNGFIDDGRELFGVATEQPPSPDANGFIALRVFDDPANGGNGDGIISALDQVFPDLVLWTDGNRNGVSEPWELAPLLDRGVVSIRLDYRLAERSDRYGNSFRWSSTAYRQDGRPLSAVDVIFVMSPD